MGRKKDVLKEMKEFWGEVVRDEEVSIQHRLKASELLIKVGEEKVGVGGADVVIIGGEDDL